MGNTDSVPASKPLVTGSADTSSPDYWRAQGNALAEARNAAFADSKAAWAAGNRGRAHELSEKGKKLAAEANKAHSRAAELFMERNNARRPPGEIDLHGLKVKEAMVEAERAVAAARAAGQPKLVFIVGRGRHSADGVPRLKPAVEGLVRKHNLRVTPNKPNPGCITVEFVSKKERGWVGWLTDVGCVIS